MDRTDRKQTQEFVRGKPASPVRWAAEQLACLDTTNLDASGIVLPSFNNRSSTVVMKDTSHDPDGRDNPNFDSSANMEMVDVVHHTSHPLPSASKLTCNNSGEVDEPTLDTIVTMSDVGFLMGLNMTGNPAECKGVSLGIDALDRNPFHSPSVLETIKPTTFMDTAILGSTSSNNEHVPRTDIPRTIVDMSDVNSLRPLAQETVKEGSYLPDNPNLHARDDTAHITDGCEPVPQGRCEHGGFLEEGLVQIMRPLPPLLLPKLGDTATENTKHMFFDQWFKTRRRHSLSGVDRTNGGDTQSGHQLKTQNHLHTHCSYMPHILAECPQRLPMLPSAPITILSRKNKSLNKRSNSSSSHSPRNVSCMSNYRASMDDRYPTSANNLLTPSMGTLSGRIRTSNLQEILEENSMEQLDTSDNTLLDSLHVM